MSEVEDSDQTSSKVLVHDCSSEYEKKIKDFCESNHLIPVKSNEEKILDVLKSYVDLGAIFLSEDIDGVAGQGLELGKEVHSIRPELPIFLRRSVNSTIEADEDLLNKAFSAIYTIDEIDSLRDTIDEHIFCTRYPNTLLRGIEQITRDTLSYFFDDMEIEVSTPYVVKDRIIFGELFSLIPMEATWCKGYMMLQMEEVDVTNLVKREVILGADEKNFRIVNDVLGEITNMTWGAIKARFITETKPYTDISVQVPIIVNHKHQYITFGTNTPQLCFKYTLKKKNGNHPPVVIYHKFIFNLYWEPEKFCADLPTVDDLIDNGELEFF